MTSPGAAFGRARWPVAVSAVVAVLLVGCAPATETSSEFPGADASRLSGGVTVYAAASLSAAFDELAEAFEAANPAVEVLPIVYDGSGRLATQLVAGASADVFAAADERTMAGVVDAGLATRPETFATNTLVIALPAGNAAGVESLADLGREDVTTVLCAPEVPCGAASEELLSAAAVEVRAASLEQNVTAVLTKVEADEADAGLVYATDVSGSDAVEVIVPEGAADTVNRYPIVRLEGSRNPDVADAFVDFVTSTDGRAVLAGHGFGTP